MRYNRLGSTGLIVSELCLGAMTFGTDPGRFANVAGMDQAASTAMVKQALDAGINFIDTANVYTRGQSERFVGQALKDLGLARSDVVIATKVGVRWDNAQVHATSDLSPQYVRADTEASLRRLGVERIDLLQVHWPCERGTPLEETLATLTALQQEGKIRHFGLCNYDALPVSDAVKASPLARKLADLAGEPPARDEKREGGMCHDAGHRRHQEPEQVLPHVQTPRLMVKGGSSGRAPDVSAE